MWPVGTAIASGMNAGQKRLHGPSGEEPMLNCESWLLGNSLMQAHIKVIGLVPHLADRVRTSHPACGAMGNALASSCYGEILAIWPTSCAEAANQMPRETFDSLDAGHVDGEGWPTRAD